MVATNDDIIKKLDEIKEVLLLQYAPIEETKIKIDSIQAKVL